MTHLRSVFRVSLVPFAAAALAFATVGCDKLSSPAAAPADVDVSGPAGDAWDADVASADLVDVDAPPVPDESVLEPQSDAICAQDAFAFDLQTPDTVNVSGMLEFVDLDGSAVEPGWAGAGEIQAVDVHTGRVWRDALRGDGGWGMIAPEGTYDLRAIWESDVCASGSWCPDVEWTLERGVELEAGASWSHRIEVATVRGGVTLDGAEMPADDGPVRRGHLAFVDVDSGEAIPMRLNTARPAEVSVALPAGRTWEVVWQPWVGGLRVGDPPAALPVGHQVLGRVESGRDGLPVTFDATSEVVDVAIRVGGAQMPASAPGGERGEIGLSALDAPGGGASVGLGSTGEGLRLRLVPGRWSATLFTGPEDEQAVLPPLAMGGACTNGCHWRAGVEGVLDFTWHYGGPEPPTHSIIGTATLFDASGRALPAACAQVRATRASGAGSRSGSVDPDSGRFEVSGLGVGTWDLWLLGSGTDGCPQGARLAAQAVRVEGDVAGLELRAGVAWVSLVPTLDGAPLPDDGERDEDREGRGVIVWSADGIGPVAWHPLGETGDGAFEGLLVRGRYRLELDTLTFDTKTSRRGLHQDVLPTGTVALASLAVAGDLSAELPIAARAVRGAVELGEVQWIWPDAELGVWLGESSQTPPTGWLPLDAEGGFEGRVFAGSRVRSVGPSPWVLGSGWDESVGLASADQGLCERR